MATKKTADEIQQTAESLSEKDLRKEQEEALSELVPFLAFKDSGKYKDDITVVVNGKTWRIKRGVQVMVPKYIYTILRQSIEQDAKTADFIEAQRSKADF